jgi:hypothetical protein
MIAQTHYGRRLNFTISNPQRYFPFIQVQNVSLTKKHKHNRSSQIADVKRFVVAIEYEHLSVHLHKRTYSFELSQKKPASRRVVLHTLTQKLSGLY